MPRDRGKQTIGPVLFVILVLALLAIGLIIFSGAEVGQPGALLP